MARPRKSTQVALAHTAAGEPPARATPRRAKSGPIKVAAKLMDAVVKLAEALERDATHKVGHPFARLESGADGVYLSSEQPEAV